MIAGVAESAAGVVQRALGGLPTKISNFIESAFQNIKDVFQNLFGRPRRNTTIFTKLFVCLKVVS
jgi:hypothetical protein